MSPKPVAGPDRGRQACRGHQEPLGAGRAAVLDPNTSKGHSDKIKEQSGPALNVSPAQRIVLPCCFPDNLWLSGSHFPSETETRDLETLHFPLDDCEPYHAPEPPKRFTCVNSLNSHGGLLGHV